MKQHNTIWAQQREIFIHKISFYSDCYVVLDPYKRPVTSGTVYCLSVTWRAGSATFTRQTELRQHVCTRGRWQMAHADRVCGDSRSVIIQKEKEKHRSRLSIGLTPFAPTRFPHAVTTLFGGQPFFVRQSFIYPPQLFMAHMGWWQHRTIIQSGRNQK